MRKIHATASEKFLCLNSNNIFARPYCQHKHLWLTVKSFNENSYKIAENYDRVSILRTYSTVLKWRERANLLIKYILSMTITNVGYT